MIEQEKSGFQYAVIQDNQLETYTANGWEFVQLVDVPGTEMMHEVAHFVTAQPQQLNSSYTPPPVVSAYAGPSGNVVRWSMVKVLVRRDRAAHDVQTSFELLNNELREELKRLKANHVLVEKQLEEVGNIKRNLEKACDEQRRALDVRKGELQNMQTARDLLKKHLMDVELDIGKREMDRILGRFPDPPVSTNLSLGDEDK